MALVLLPLVLAAGGVVHAGTRVSVGELSADGLTVLDLQCELEGEGGGFLAGAAIVGALAKEKAALDACGPKGAAVRASFRWAGAVTDEVAVLAASDAPAGACVVRTLAKVKAAMAGRCAATLLLGPDAAARKAAAGLAVEPSKPDKAPEKVPEKVPEKAPHPLLDPKAWDTISVDEQGWHLWVVGGAKVVDGSLDLDGQRWDATRSEHSEQLLWVFWSASAPFDAAVVGKITAEAYRFAPELTWHPVATLPANDAEDFPEVVIEKAKRSPHHLYRLVAKGPKRRHLVLSLFSENMPDEVVVMWLRAISFPPLP